MPNRLAKERSPYLLAHQNNPVDWYPWGEEALNRAKAEQKPIFLSVGYATCHWCHVMEHESFEDEETARIMNEHFINIKVDREERPDVDKVYMSYVQATSGRGGWPMSVFLTPDLEPIYGGSYYPKEDIFQGGQLAMPAFKVVLRRLASLWRINNEDLAAKGADMMRRLSEALAQSVGHKDGEPSFEADLAEHSLLKCEEQLRQRFDSVHGGFGGAPKFPRPCEIQELLHTYLLMHGRPGREGDAANVLHMATFSLDRMAAGGVYDHIGGGFHRYSVDEFWHVPHFEKMLYDQPQLVNTYLAAYQITGEERYARVARGILDYLRRDMTAPGGGLCSAEDADSFDVEEGKKKEGSFYLWKYDEVASALGPELAPLFCRVYNVKPEGNCTLSNASDPHGEFVGRNVPIILEEGGAAALAGQLGMQEGELMAKLAECHKRLHDVRNTRPRPLRDDKVVTAWNGMAIGAFAVASRALGPSPPLFPVDGTPASQYLDYALQVAHFAKSNLYESECRTLRRSYREGPSAIPAFCEDYVHLISGLLDLYECGGGVEWLQWAVELQATQDRLFGDPVAGGYFSTSGTDPSIKIRIKDDYDGAEPAPSSVAAYNLFRLAALLPEDKEAPAAAAPAPAGAPAEASISGSSNKYSKMGRQVLAAFQEQLFSAPLAVPKMCCAAHLMLSEPLRQVVVAGALSDPATQALLAAAHANFVPDKAVILVDTDDAAAVCFLSEHNPLALAMVQEHYAKSGQGQEGQQPPTVFICADYRCSAPTSDPAAVAAALRPQPQGPLGGAKPQVMTEALPGLQ